MDLSKINGVRLTLFTVIFLTAGLKAIEPMFSSQVATAIEGILAILGAIWSFLKMQSGTPASGSIDTTVPPVSDLGKS
jgi:hypothetical protein